MPNEGKVINCKYKCTYEPMGDHGLEGFILGESYHGVRDGEKIKIKLNDEESFIRSKIIMNRYFKEYPKVEFKNPNKMWSPE